MNDDASICEEYINFIGQVSILLNVFFNYFCQVFTVNM